MKRIGTRFREVAAVLAVGLSLFGAASASARIDGVAGTSFAFTAGSDYLMTGEGNLVRFWGLANGTGPIQYPAPTLILDQGVPVTISLTNTLPVATSLVFPGQVGVTSSGGSPGLLAAEAAPSGGTVSYAFTPATPGTYIYQSGTSPELQIEMGIVGAIIVRPAGFVASAPTAYGSADSSYTDEFLFLMTEMDPRIHDTVDQHGVAGLLAADYLSDYRPNYWFLNGRNAPDTMLEAGSGAPWLPHQPYNCMPMMHPGDRLLVRGILGGREQHPLHLHANHFRILARDGQVRQSAPGPVADLSTLEFTHAGVPGGTFDATFEWTGEKLGWDIYGSGPGYEHDCTRDANGYDVTTKEYCNDHLKPFPVRLPSFDEVMIGDFYNGSPFLGFSYLMPPDTGGFNPDSGYVYMWHSHQERDMVNNNVFPGGMMTMLMVMPPSVPLP
jgi:FtsP/CotA-like multicopper oxidase with cupredoxin domain